MELISGSKQEWRVSGGSGGESRVSGMVMESLSLSPTECDCNGT